MTDEEMLEQDILRNGIRQPLLVTQEGLILNGWRRYRAAKKMGFKYVPVVIFHGTVEEIDIEILIPPYDTVDNVSNREHATSTTAG